MRVTFRIALLILCISAVTIVGACKKEESKAGATKPAAKLTKVRLALNWKPEPQFGGFYAAQQIGAYTSRGLDVEILPGGSGTPTVQMVAAGQAEFGIVSADELVIARSKGADVVALFATYQTNPQGIMTHASRGFKDIGDVFKGGGTLAMQRGLPYAEFLVNKYGENGVKIVPYAGGIGIFLKDKQFSQQCFVTSEPILARKSGAEEKTFLVADAGYNPYTTVVVTRGSYLRQHEHETYQMTLAVTDGWRA
jgi:NitT/TauT family transport system substrate-binding protein